VSAALDIPANYLGKILHELARSGILNSTRGKRGGFTLAVPAGRLSLLTVVSLFDDFSDESRCLLGRPTCSDHSPCSAHAGWKVVSQQVTAFLTETTVGDLLKAESS
jgi:Rrf2 family protein